MSLLSKSSIQQRQRGVTLVEVLVVIAIMAILSTVVAFAVIPMYVASQKRTARLSASSLRHGVGAWRVSHLGEQCPDFARLRADKAVDRESNPQDPWGSDYVIICADDDVTVVSLGPDKKIGTEDDIIAPPDAVVAHGG